MVPAAKPTAQSGLENDVIRLWVDTWRNAGRELEEIRRIESGGGFSAVAVDSLFRGMESVLARPAPATTGLVEQQKWFSRIRTGTAA